MLVKFLALGSQVSACKTVLWVYDPVLRPYPNILHPYSTDRALGDYVSAFPAGMNVAATWDRNLARLRGEGMGAEHRNKGVDVQLGPVCGPLGRSPEGGRNWVSRNIRVPWVVMLTPF